jgi:uncharacterized protein
MKSRRGIKRRATLQGLTTAGAFSLFGGWTASCQTKSSRGTDSGHGSVCIRDEIWDAVVQAPFIDTHEHLIEEAGRFTGTDHPRVQADDWSMILCHYINSDMVTCGMPKDEYDAFFSPDVDPVRKWSLLEPYWPHIKNTGYGQAVRISLRELYGVDELSASTVDAVQSGYEKMRQPGFYRRILVDMANIESCQVNCLEGEPFMETAMPDILMQDISIVGMFSGPRLEQFGDPTGITVSALSDWHRVIDWWFEKYSRYAVAVKSQNAYSRDINYEDISAEDAEPLFNKRLNGQGMTTQERKALEDHLFWYATRKATESGLPVKLHTGYYAGQDRMSLNRLIGNAGSATELCLNAPETPFVFMHINYPYYEELISVAKHFTNAHVDMCWSWIINPVAAKDFLKKYLVTAPANKILTFGGDYVPVEPVLGHAAIARRGIALALSELVDEGWMSMDDALGLVDPIMHGNARTIFALSEKQKALSNVPWG